MNRVLKFPFIVACCILASLPHESAGAADRVEFMHKAVRFIGLPADPKKSYDTTLLSTKDGMKRLVTAFDRLMARSPYSARKVAELKRSGTVYLIYLPGDPPKSQATGENIAVFMPKFIPGANKHRKSYPVVVGRHGIKWPRDELAAVLAHELVGHGMQHKRGVIGKLRVLDLECEAYLYEERANQDLGLEKRSGDMVRFRQALENHWCADFKIYMRRAHRTKMPLWDQLNPDISKLLKIYEEYLEAVRR